MYPLLLSYFNLTRIIFFDLFSKNTQITAFMKILPLNSRVVSCERTDGQGYMTKPIVAFCNFAARVKRFVDFVEFSYFGVWHYWFSVFFVMLFITENYSFELFSECKWTTIIQFKLRYWRKLKWNHTFSLVSWCSGRSLTSILPEYDRKVLDYYFGSQFCLY
jgi:hypothetical protein